MKLDLMREKAKLFTPPPNASSLVSLRIWHCKYGSLAGLSAFTSLEELSIGTYPDASFDAFSTLTRLRYLKIVHLPKVTTLRSLTSLPSIEVLSLATLPSWDSSNKHQVVDAIDPLAELPTLRHLELLGVVPKDLSLAPLERCPALASMRASGYAANESKRFYAATQVANAFNPGSSFDA
jgi:hypothetical protein